MFNDTIADMLTRIRNATRCQYSYVDVTSSKMVSSVLNIFKNEGFILDYIKNDKLRLTRVFLRYFKGRRSAITNLRRLSKPGRRVYVKSDEIPVILKGLGLSIISTSSGIKSGRDARKESLGGELVCSLW